MQHWLVLSTDDIGPLYGFARSRWWLPISVNEGRKSGGEEGLNVALWVTYRVFIDPRPIEGPSRRAHVPLGIR